MTKANLALLCKHVLYIIYYFFYKQKPGMFYKIKF